jgi:hypothetical protein
MSNNIERLIVLGAGASSGYPLGSELIEEIKQYKNLTKDYFGDNNMSKESDEYSRFLQDIIDFATDVANSVAPSIDFYTSRIHDKEKQKIAKYLIASIVSSYKIDQEKCWYGHLLQLFFPIFQSDQSNEDKLSKIQELCKKIKIITFNYDLSLELYLYNFLKNNIFFGKDDAVILDEAKNCIFDSIHHVYGSLYDQKTTKYELLEKDYIQKIKHIQCATDYILLYMKFNEACIDKRAKIYNILRQCYDTTRTLTIEFREYKQREYDRQKVALLHSTKLPTDVCNYIIKEFL